MKKYWKIGLSAFLTNGLLTACNEEEGKTDLPNMKQQADAPTERIISLIPSNTDLGLNEEISDGTRRKGSHSVDRLEAFA